MTKKGIINIQEEKYDILENHKEDNNNIIKEEDNTKNILIQYDKTEKRLQETNNNYIN